jgi:hypothetical protein
MIMLGKEAGKYTDAQYLFTEDVCGYGKSHKPRHGKVCANLRLKLQAIQGEQIAAFTACQADIDSGGCPAAALEDQRPMSATNSLKTGSCRLPAEAAPSMNVRSQDAVWLRRVHRQKFALRHS